MGEHFNRVMALSHTVKYRLSPIPGISRRAATRGRDLIASGSTNAEARSRYHGTHTLFGPQTEMEFSESWCSCFCPSLRF